MIKLYLKATPQPQPTASQSRLPKTASLLLIGIGSFVLVFVASPIITYELISAPQLKSADFLSPQSQVQAQEIDYTQASSWFPTAPQVKPRLSQITHYTIDIPKLKITHATVAIGGEDLTTSLIQYAGTANPGEFGASVIFGHSILRQFYNPSQTNPNRYLSIFSTIMTLQTGDKIFVNYDGIEYTYSVRKKYQLEPQDIEVLTQYYDQKLLRLITCVPEGTYLHRGVIEAVLQP